MSWAVFHSESEALASAAHEALARREGNRAAELFRRAAEAEEKALDAITPSRIVEALDEGEHGFSPRSAS
jgi:hypothetical protein